MSHWGSDSGILRKNRAKENQEQLLVFGYSCKLFRDDEKAVFIDQGKHLIPWMGQDILKIDRYDGRGALSDLKAFEASREGYDTLRWLGLSESEKKLEELCDNERYYSLEINEEEEEMYKEEIAKRQKTNAISFNYGNSELAEPIQEKEEIPTVPEKEEEPFIPLPILDVPVDISIPKTIKEYARIEKTALFVCHQGPQMEILIKAKQSENPQFSFLTVNDPLYKFYRHVLAAFKNGRYLPQCDKKQGASEDAQSQEDIQDSHYLHPSLLSSTSAKLNVSEAQDPPTPTIPYRRTADCAYSQLVNRIQGTGLGNSNRSEFQDANAVPNQMQLINQMNLEQQYHQYYYVQQFYDYWRHSVLNSEQGAMYAGLPLNFSQLDPNMQSYIHQLAWAQFMQHHERQTQEAQSQVGLNNSYAQIVSNLNKEGVNPYAGNVSQTPSLETVMAEPNLVKYANEVKKPLLFLAAAYGSGSESESDEVEKSNNASVVTDNEVKSKAYRIPPQSLQTVIDKMAEYVMKNGNHFEEIIKQKADFRFEFLNKEHEYYAYYKNKLDELRGEPNIRNMEELKPSSSKIKKVIAPVSFSIKKTKEEPQKEIKSALPIEDSSDDEINQENNSNSPSSQLLIAKRTDDNASPIATSKTSTVNNNSLLTYKITEPALSVSKQEFNFTKVVLKCVSSPEMFLNNEKPLIKEDETVLKNSQADQSKIDSFSTKEKKSDVSKQRSRSPTKTPPSTSKCFTLYKENEMAVIPKKQQKIEKKIKSTSVIDIFEIGEDLTAEKNKKSTNKAIAKDDPILEMMHIEKNSKSLKEKIADENDKARQLERKRKAAMFLKLKSVETRLVSKNISSEKTSRPKFEKKNGVSSPSSSENSAITICSKSGTREKSKAEDRNRSRSFTKRDIHSTRRSRSRDRQRDFKKHRKSRNRSETRSRESDSQRKKEKRKKTHKRKHFKSKRKSRKHRRSRSFSRSRSRSVSTSTCKLNTSRVRSRSRSISARSHISVDSS